jgi:signal transduction histidine kinase
MAMSNSAVGADDRGGAGRSFRLRGFPDWPVRAKLATVVLIPAIAAVAVGVFRVTDLLDRAGDYDADAAVSRAQAAAADLITELGREQLTAVADSTGTAESATALEPRDQQEALTDSAVAEVTRLVDEAGRPGDVDRRFRALENQLTRLDEVREGSTGEAGDNSLTPAQTVRAYQDVSGAALLLGGSLVASVADDALQTLSLSTQSLAATNRQITLEDAIVLTITAEGPESMNPAELRAAVTDRAAAFSDFEARASAEQQGEYSAAFMGTEGQARTQRFNEVLRTVNAGGTPEVAPADWLSVAVPSAAAAESVRQSLSAEQVALAESLRSDSRSQALREAVIVLVLLALGVAVMFYAARSIVQPLRRLRTDAITIADTRLPQAIDRIREAGPEAGLQVQPVGVDTTEEIGQVARAFDAVHTEAVRLAAQQEQLRRNVNELFVNLSRRSQALVERQLALIDRLESDEQDPDQLSQLFRLDHLAARMRRNNDNLMVLAGSDAGRSAGRPMPVLDVVRAAVSETEQYERVAVRSVPSVTVGGATSHDLVHLLAELLDNATVFSSPDTTVAVSVEGSRSDGLRIDVTDQGLGIGPEDLGTLNAKLADPPEADAAVPRQMGLFVVAHLARRHGISVGLRPGDGGRGTVASVYVPPDALTGGSGLAGPSGATAATAALPPATVLPAGAQGPDDRTGPIPVPTRPAVPAARPPGLPAPVGVSQAVPAPAAPVGATPAPLFAKTSPPIPPGTLNGASRILDAEPPADPPTPPPEEETPIFREVSAWFRASTPSTPTPPRTRPEAPAARGRHGHATVTRLPGSPLVTATPPATAGAVAVGGRPGAGDFPAVAAAAFATAADEGWRAAAAVEEEEEEAAEVTAAGLPKRRPMAHLLPGSAPTTPESAEAVRRRDADSVRGRLSSYQRGLQSGRSRVREAGDEPEPGPDEAAGSGGRPDERRYAP